MPTFHFETDPEMQLPPFNGDAGVLVYFLSLAFSTRYGSQHALSQLALALRGEHKIDLGPLTTFADRDVEEEADATELERVWQDAQPLAETLRNVMDVLDAPDDRCNALVAEFPDLRERLRDLLAMAEGAAARGARVRMSFDL